MNFYFVVRDKWGYLSFNKSTNKKLFSLGDFLTIDVKDKIDADFIFEWIEGFEKGVSLNTSFLSKIDINTIKIEPQFAEERSIKIPKQTFIKIINEWLTIIEKYPQKVTITQDGDEFKIEAEY